MSSEAADDGDEVAWARQRRGLVRDATGIGAYALAFGASFGAISVASGLDVAQTAVLSAAMFTGASQLALVGVLAAGGSALSAFAAALLLGARNGLYGVRLATLLPPSDRRLPRLPLTAHLVIDETTAMAVAQEDPGGPVRLLGDRPDAFRAVEPRHLAGRRPGGLVGDPRVLGLDAAAPAAFVALLWPRLDDALTRAVALAAVAVALLLVPVAPAGVPVLATALVPVLAVLATRGRRVAT